MLNKYRSKNQSFQNCTCFSLLVTQVIYALPLITHVKRVFLYRYFDVYKRYKRVTFTYVLFKKFLVFKLVPFRHK